MACDLEVTNECAHCKENISSYITLQNVQGRLSSKYKVKIVLLLPYSNRNSFKTLIKSTTFTSDHEYDLRHVCAHTILAKNVKYTMSSANKERKKMFFSLVILYLWIKKIARAIFWIAWVTSFSSYIDYSKGQKHHGQKHYFFRLHEAFLG